MSFFRKQPLGCTLSGLCAGLLNGLLGGGGGLLLIPGLRLSGVEDDALFPMSVAVMAPVTALSLWLTSRVMALPWADAAPYLLGSAGGGILALVLARRISTLWLHRILGVMLLWGGVRYLW